MITKLTEEQEQLMETVKKEWIDLALNSGKDLTFAEIKESVYWLYEKSNLERPFIIIMDNPYHSQIACNVIKERFGGKFSKYVYSQVDSQVRSQVRSQVDSQVYSQVDSQVRSQVDSQVYSQVRSQVDSQKLEWFSIFTGLGWNSGYMSWIDYYSRIGITKSELVENYKIFFKKGVWEVITLSGFCVITKLPIKVLRDDRNRLHSTSMSAIQWRGGIEYYFIHGVSFEKKLFEQVINRKLSPKKLLELGNTDQRFVALNHYGFEKALKELKPRLVDESKRGNKLYEIRFGEFNMKFLHYIDTVNGEPRISFVKPKFDDADQAMAWKHNMTKDEYQNKLRVEA